MHVKHPSIKNLSQSTRISSKIQRNIYLKFPKVNALTAKSLRRKSIQSSLTLKLVVLLLEKSDKQDNENQRPWVGHALSFQNSWWAFRERGFWEARTYLARIGLFSLKKPAIFIWVISGLWLPSWWSVEEIEDWKTNW